MRLNHFIATTIATTAFAFPAKAAVSEAPLFFEKAAFSQTEAEISPFPYEAIATYCASFTAHSAQYCMAHQSLPYGPLVEEKIVSQFAYLLRNENPEAIRIIRMVRQTAFEYLMGKQEIGAVYQVMRQANRELEEAFKVQEEFYTIRKKFVHLIPNTLVIGQNTKWGKKLKKREVE